MDAQAMLREIDAAPTSALPALVGIVESARAALTLRMGRATGLDGVGANVDIGTAAHRLGVSVRTVRRMADEGELPFALRVRGRLSFDSLGLERFIARARAQGGR